MKLYFELKKLDDKIGTIRAVLIQQGKKAIVATGEKIAIKDWATGKPKAIGKNSGINQQLRKYITAFDEYMSKVKLADEIPSLDKAREYVKGHVNSVNTNFGQKDFFTLIERFRTEKEGLMREGALKPYKTLSLHLTDFSPNVQFSDFSEDFAERFSKFLATKSKHVTDAKDLQNPTINKMLVTLKVFCKWAYKKKLTSATEWMNIKKVEEINQRIISLTSAELVKYHTFDFGDKTNLERARDIFCFASFLGLRYNDLLQVVPKNIKGDKLHINTNKTNTELKLKIIPKAKAILEKYNYQLPLDISNQKLNKNIKDGVRLAGIDRQEDVVTQYLKKQGTVQKYVHQLISIHDARKTFITLCLEKGLSIPEVMQMSTHKSFGAFERYINIEKEKVDQKLEAVFDQA